MNLEESVRQTLSESREYQLQAYKEDGTMEVSNWHSKEDFVLDLKKKVDKDESYESTMIMKRIAEMEYEEDEDEIKPTLEKKYGMETKKEAVELDEKKMTVNIDHDGSNDPNAKKLGIKLKKTKHTDFSFDATGEQKKLQKYLALHYDSQEDAEELHPEIFESVELDEAKTKAMKFKLGKPGRDSEEEVQDFVKSNKDIGISDVAIKGKDVTLTFSKSIDTKDKALSKFIDNIRKNLFIDKKIALVAESVELDEKKMTPAQKKSLDKLINSFYSATDPDSLLDLEDPDKIIDRIRKQFGKKIADQVEDGEYIHHFGREYQKPYMGTMGKYRNAPRITKKGGLNKQDINPAKRRSKQGRRYTQKLNPNLPEAYDESVELDEARKRVNPYDVLAKIRKTNDRKLKDILSGALNTFDISYDSEELIQHIADEMKKAGYSPKEIKNMTESVELDEANKYSSEYDKLIKRAAKLPWDKKPKVRKSKGNVEYFGEVDGYKVEFAVQDMGPASYFTGLNLAAPGRSKYTYLFKDSGEKILDTVFAGGVSDKDQKVNIDDFEKALDMIETGAFKKEVKESVELEEKRRKLGGMVFKLKKKLSHTDQMKHWFKIRHDKNGQDILEIPGVHWNFMNNPLYVLVQYDPADGKAAVDKFKKYVKSTLGFTYVRDHDTKKAADDAAAAWVKSMKEATDTQTYSWQQINKAMMNAGYGARQILQLVKALKGKQINKGDMGNNDAYYWNDINQALMKGVGLSPSAIFKVLQQLNKLTR